MHELDLAFQGISTTVTIFLFSAVTSSHCLFRCLSCVCSSGLREWDVTQDLCGILNLSLLLPYSPSRTPEVPQHDITVTLLREGVPFYWKLPYCDERDQSSNSWPFFPEFFTYLHVRQCCTGFFSWHFETQFLKYVLNIRDWHFLSEIECFVYKQLNTLGIFFLLRWMLIVSVHHSMEHIGMQYFQVFMALSNSFGISQWHRYWKHGGDTDRFKRSPTDPYIGFISKKN